jgi:hypothetical protein
MSRYTVKIQYGDKEIERYDHRQPAKLVSILQHPSYHRSGESGPFGEAMQHPDTFIIYDSKMERLFCGNVTGAINLLRKLR